MMRLIAYTSLSHFGFITLGIFAMTSQGQSGSTLYMVNHGFSTAGLFIVAGFLASRRGSRLIADFGGVQRVAPLLAGFFLVMGLATLALPGLNAFVSEFLVLIGTYTRYPVYAVLATLGMVLAAIYVLLWYQRVAHGPAAEGVKGFRDLGLRELAAVVPLLVPGRRARLLPEAAAERDQPGRRPHPAEGRADRPGADRGRRTAVTGRPGRRDHAPIAAPTLEYGALLPMLIVFGAACAGVLVEAFVARPNRFSLQLPITMAGLVGALVAVVWYAAKGASAHKVVAQGAVTVDGPALFVQATVLVLAFGGVLMMAERQLDPGGDAFAPMASAKPGGSEERDVTVAGLAADRGLPARAVRGRRHAALPRGERPAHDVRRARGALAAAVPHVRPGPPAPAHLAGGRAQVLPARRFSSAFFLFGIAFLYGYSGSLRLSDIATATGSTLGMEPILLIGIALVGVGLLFKVSAVPFHSWTPDVYQGAPTPVTGFMAACTKVAAFGALLRVFYVALGGVRWDWRPMMWIVAIAHDGGRLAARGHPDRRQAAARVLLDRARRLHPDRRAGRSAAPASRRRSSTS